MLAPPTIPHAQKRTHSACASRPISKSISKLRILDISQIIFIGVLISLKHPSLIPLLVLAGADDSVDDGEHGGNDGRHDGCDPARVVLGSLLGFEDERTEEVPWWWNLVSA